MRADPASWRALGIGTAMAVELLALSWAGWTFGAWLDARWGTAPWAGVVCTALGIGIASALATRAAQRLQAGDE